MSGTAIMIWLMGSGGVMMAAITNAMTTVITGASDDETRSTKADVVAEALRRLQEQGVDTANAVMVGDRGYDILGAAAHGLPTILVEWGYGSPEEAGEAFAVVHSADQLRGLLLG